MEGSNIWWNYYLQQLATSNKPNEIMALGEENAKQNVTLVITNLYLTGFYKRDELRKRTGPFYKQYPRENGESKAPGNWHPETYSCFSPQFQIKFKNTLCNKGQIRCSLWANKSLRKRIRLHENLISTKYHQRDFWRQLYCQTHHLLDFKRTVTMRHIKIIFGCSHLGTWLEQVAHSVWPCDRDGCKSGLNRTLELNQSISLSFILSLSQLNN